MKTRTKEDQHEIEQLRDLSMKIIYWLTWLQYERCADDLEEQTGKHITVIYYGYHGWGKPSGQLQVDYGHRELNDDPRYGLHHISQYVGVGSAEMAGLHNWRRANKPERPIVAIQPLDARQDDLLKRLDTIEREVAALRRMIRGE